MRAKLRYTLWLPPNTAFRARPVHGDGGGMQENSLSWVRWGWESGENKAAIVCRTKHRREESCTEKTPETCKRLLLGCLAENDQRIHRRKLLKVGERTTKKNEKWQRLELTQCQELRLFFMVRLENPQFLGALAREIRRIFWGQWSMINPRLNCSCLVEQKGKIIFKTRKWTCFQES